PTLAASATRSSLTLRVGVVTCGVNVFILSSIIIWSRKRKLWWWRSLVEICFLRENIVGYRGNDDKRIKYGEMRFGKRWKNGLETVETEAAIIGTARIDLPRRSQRKRREAGGWGCRELIYTYVHIILRYCCMGIKSNS